MKRTIGLVTILAMIFTMMPAFGAAAAVPAAGEKISINVPNGDFEQSEAVDISEHNYGKEIPGWEVEYYPAALNHTPSDNLFHQVITDNGTNQTKVAHVYDLCDTNADLGNYKSGQIILATEYIALPGVSKSQAVNYTMDFDYIAPTFDTSNGSNLYNKKDYQSRFKVGIAFYNDSNQVYKSTGWANTSTANGHLNQEYQTFTEFFEWKNDKSEWPIKPGEWDNLKWTREAPAGATKTRLFFIGAANNKNEFAVDNVKLSYTYPEVESNVSGNLSVDYYGGGVPQDIHIVENMNAATNRFYAVNDADKSDFSLAFPDYLEGATYIQTNWSDWSNSVYKSNDSKEWLSFKITQPATVYYLTYSSYIADSCQSFLKEYTADGWTWMENNKVWTVDDSGSAPKDSMRLLKKDIVASPEAPVTITANTVGSVNNPPVYSFAIQWAPTLTVTSSGNGTVTPTGTTKVFKGSEQSVTAVPEDGWKVESVKINGVDSAVLESFSVTVDADTTIEVTFAEIPETPPTLSTFDKTYVSDDKTNSVTFGTVAEGSKTTVKEYGIVYSATDSVDPQIGKENCYKLKAEKALSANGHYGIEIKGDLLLNTTYYTRTYVIYQAADGTEKTVYGEIKTISLQ